MAAGPAGGGMNGLVAIAAAVGNPAEGPRLVMRTLNGRPVFGITGVNRGAAAMQMRSASTSARWASWSRQAG